MPAKKVSPGVGNARLVKELQNDCDRYGLGVSLTAVLDGPYSVEIEVSEADVGNSRRKDPGHCAIAVAAKRAGKFDAVLASRSRFYGITNGVAFRYKMPNSAVRELTSFDRGASFSPGTYSMGPLPQSSRLGVPRDNHTAGKSGKSGPGRRRTAVIDNIRASVGS